MVQEGTKVYIPSLRQSGEGLGYLAVATFSDGSVSTSELGFIDVIETYNVNNAQMYPDVSSIQVLSEGVTIDESTARGTLSASGSIPIKFGLDKKIGNSGVKISGSFSYTPSMSVSLDYSGLKVTSLRAAHYTASP